MTTAAMLTTKMQSLTEEQQRMVLDFINKLPALQSVPQTSLYGLFQGYDTTEEEIAEARHEMWGNFPREDY